MNEVLFVHYPKCSTCQKAAKWLSDHGIVYEGRDIVLDRPSEDELRAWWQQSGLPLFRFFNTSGLRYRALGLKDQIKGESDDVLLGLLGSDGMLVKRPLVVCEKGVLVGFREAEWSALFLE